MANSHGWTITSEGPPSKRHPGSPGNLMVWLCSDAGDRLQKLKNMLHSFLMLWTAQLCVFSLFSIPCLMRDSRGSAFRVVGTHRLYVKNGL